MASGMSIYDKCRSTRQELLDLISRVGDTPTHREALEDTLQRFMLWVGNLGALRQPSSKLSLDQRLGNAPEVSGLICRHLDDICEAVDDLSAFLFDGGESRDVHDVLEEKTSDPDVGSEESFDEAGMILQVIVEAISSLFRLGILVRKSSPTDRFKRALQLSDTSFNDTFDINYVKEKYPKMRDTKEDWLPSRLGRLISQRRMFIKYSRDHKVRLEFEGESPEKLATQTERQSSKATTFHLNKLPANAFAPPADDGMLSEEEDADDVMSVMSASTMSNTLSVLKLPFLADLSIDGSPFECPICFTLQHFQREKSWKVHAFRDLKAYVCTAGASHECSREYFGDRNTWFEHELYCHRAQYTCTLCQNQQPVPRDVFKAHVQELHPQLTDHQVKAVQDVSRHIPTHFDANDCPFCGDWAEKIRQRADPKGKRSARPTNSADPATMVSATRFKRHVALHQEQLAIFAMPRAVEDGDRVDKGGTDESIAISFSGHSETPSVPLKFGSDGVEEILSFDQEHSLSSANEDMSLPESPLPWSNDLQSGDGKVSSEDFANYVEGDRTVTNDDDIQDEDEVVRCICGFDDYPGPPPFDEDTKHGLKDANDLDPIFVTDTTDDAAGFFVQCDICKVWQHGACVGIETEESSPVEYFCEECRRYFHKIFTASNGQRYSHYLPLKRASRTA